MVSIGDNTMDAVVLFYILCSVKDVGQVLREAKRVLKKDGTVYVFQHSDAEPKTWRYLLQKLINPIHKVLLSCDLLRKYTTDFEQAGFSDVDLKHVDAACFRIAIPYLVPHLIGTCRK
ncbi:thiol S-methyltransferase TMT1A-like [Lineus longissimus]|uniref:thiol S-methyltransferase TMT1A-like n=1 Tax=Lineus longissimus TaxID=88925 RepID=UPI00315D644E